MDIIKVPLNSAVVPNEEARQPDVDKDGQPNNRNVVKTSMGVTANTTAFKNVLSQPPKDLNHKEKLLWLQDRRTSGLWAQCDDCNRWRYLPQVLERHELPTKWYCWMNLDKSLASCLAPEAPICLYDEDDLIHAEYAAGSLVIARLPGFPWWPAMVCDCPDTEQYYWLDGFSDIPTHYNVVFFDAFEISRAWMTPEQLLPYKDNTALLKKSLKIKKYKSRLVIAINEVNDAAKLSFSARLKKYSFVAKFNGRIITPKKVKKHEKTKYKNSLKRKFNIKGFSDESSDEENTEVNKNLTKNNKGQKETKKIATKDNYPHVTDTENTMDLSSLAVQVDNNSESIDTIISEVSVTNKNKQETIRIGASHEPESIQTQSTTLCTLIEEDSEKSDNFDF